MAMRSILKLALVSVLVLNTFGCSRSTPCAESELSIGDVHVKDGSTQDMSQFEQLRFALGFDSTYYMYDADGNVVGVAMKVGKTGQHPHTETQSKFPQSGDADVCCETHPVYFFNSTLTNVHGQTCTIAQMAQVGAFQFIRHARCSSSGNCPGECVPQPVTVSLAIHPPRSNEATSFHFFNVPGYCVCHVSPNSNRFKS